jgi:hypothetical protein
MKFNIKDGDATLEGIQPKFGKTISANKEIKTNDEIRQLLKYRFLGCDIIYQAVPAGKNQAEGKAYDYQIILKRFGRNPISVAERYNLPVKELSFLRGLNELEKELKDLGY